MRVKFCSLCGRMGMWNFVFCPWCGQEFPMVPEDAPDAETSIATALERCESVRHGGMEARMRVLEESLDAMEQDLEGFLFSRGEWLDGKKGEPAGDLT